MIDWIIANYAPISSVFGSTVAIASVIVKLTPTTKDDAILGKVVELVSRLSIFNTKTDQKIIDNNK